MTAGPMHVLYRGREYVLVPQFDRTRLVPVHLGPRFWLDELRAADVTTAPTQPKKENRTMSNPKNLTTKPAKAPAKKAAAPKAKKLRQYQLKELELFDRMSNLLINRWGNPKKQQYWDHDVVSNGRTIRKATDAPNAKGEYARKEVAA